MKKHNEAKQKQTDAGIPNLSVNNKGINMKMNEADFSVS